MSDEKRAILLIGSPRNKKSTSYSLGNYLLERLEGGGVQGGVKFVRKSLKDDEKLDELLESVRSADIVILSTPLYVDSAPAPVIRALELIVRDREEKGLDDGKRFVAIVNCGFPEHFHNRTALAIYRRFAEEAGFEWGCGLGLGMGGMIDGKSLGDMGLVVRNVKRALEMTADALIEDNPIPDEVVELIEKPLIPWWLYTFAGNWSWKREAKKYGVRDRLDDKPFVE